MMISCTVENKDVSPEKSLRLDSKLNGLVSGLCKSKTTEVQKLVPAGHLHSPFSMMRNDHLKLLFLESLLKDISACLLCRFVLT